MNTPCGYCKGTAQNSRHQPSLAPHALGVPNYVQQTNLIIFLRSGDVIDYKKVRSLGDSNWGICMAQPSLPGIVKELQRDRTLCLTCLEESCHCLPTDRHHTVCSLDDICFLCLSVLRALLAYLIITSLPHIKATSLTMVAGTRE